MATENGGQRTEIGRRKTEVGGQHDAPADTRREAIGRALAEAHERCPAIDEMRETSDAGYARLPCCRECAHAVPVQDGSRPLLICTNCPAQAGSMRVTDPSQCCRVFRTRRQRPPRTIPPEPPDNSVRYIPLTQGKYAIIDAADYERVAPFTWHASASGNRTYAYCVMNGRSISLHRFLTNAPRGMVVDHIDHNGLNDRQSNLRICTHQQNLHNSRPRGKSSRFKGVCWDQRGKRWVVHICHNGHNRHLGRFTDEIEAARAYDRAACALFGKYAYLNFPEEIRGRGGDGKI